MTWGLLRVINLANFALAFLGAYLTYQLATTHGLDPILTLLVIAPGFFVIGILLELGFLRFRINELTSLIVTFGLTVILESLAPAGRARSGFARAAPSACRPPRSRRLRGRAAP